MKILKSYIINTFIAGVFFAPIAIYSQFSGGYQWTVDDTIVILLFGWVFGAMLKGLFSAFKITSQEANKAVDDVKSKILKK